MRALRIFGLVLVVVATGLLSGGAAGAQPTADAVLAFVAAPGPPARPVITTPGPAAGLPAAPPPAPLAGPAPTTATTQAMAAPPPKPKPAPPAAVRGTPCRANASACVDLSANRAWLISDGAVLYGPVPITHGRKGFRTPPGTFRVQYKAADHVSTIYDAEMPYSVFFNSGIAFHEGSLKQPSHGCIHLSGKAARAFYGALGRGEIVQVVR